MSNSSQHHPKARRLFALAADAAIYLSEDPSTRNGAVALGSGTCVLGANRLVRGVPAAWHTAIKDPVNRDLKMRVTQHAEVDACLRALRERGTIEDLFVLWASCAGCARVIVDAGVSRVHTLTDASFGGCPARWRAEVDAGRQLLIDCGVDLVFYDAEELALGVQLLFDGRMIQL